MHEIKRFRLSSSFWHRMKTWSSRLVLTALVMFFVMPAPAVASDPVDTVQSGTQRVLQMLEQYPDDTHQRREKIRQAVNEYFDFEEMAKRSLGPQWGQQPPQKQQEFVDAFSQFLFNVYISRVEQYGGQEISYQSREVESRFAVVEATVSDDKAGEIPLEYRLHKPNGEWKAYDVVIEGVSLVRNYQSQFQSILAKGSFDDLLKQLQEKNKA
jgi:phospholipid transport system substrate-binding protein